MTFIADLDSLEHRSSRSSQVAFVGCIQHYSTVREQLDSVKVDCGFGGHNFSSLRDMDADSHDLGSSSVDSNENYHPEPPRQYNGCLVPNLATYITFLVASC